MQNNLYSSGEYIKKNHSYHIEDSDFKWKIFNDILESSNFNYGKINSVIEIGCGAGQILANAKKSKIFKSTCKFQGYDINPDAISLAKKKNKDLDFYNYDYLNYENINDDLVIAADVFEHVENPFEFLGKLKDRGNFFLFNIPLEISLFSMLRKKNIFKDSYNKVGHLHFYNKRTALLTLENSGYKIIKSVFAKDRLFEFKKNYNLKQFLILCPQYFFEIFSKNVASSIFGGYSLVVLAK